MLVQRGSHWREVQPGVNLCGDQAGMIQHFPHHGDVLSATGQPGSARSPQVVNGHVVQAGARPYPPPVVKAGTFFDWASVVSRGTKDPLFRLGERAQHRCEGGRERHLVGLPGLRGRFAPQPLRQIQVCPFHGPGFPASTATQQTQQEETLHREGFQSQGLQEFRHFFGLNEPRPGVPLVPLDATGRIHPVPELPFFGFSKDGPQQTQTLVRLDGAVPTDFMEPLGHDGAREIRGPQLQQGREIPIEATLHYESGLMGQPVGVKPLEQFEPVREAIGLSAAQEHVRVAWAREAPTG